MVIMLFSTCSRENVKTRKLPLENEVLNAVYPHTSCPVRVICKDLFAICLVFKI